MCHSKESWERYQADLAVSGQDAKSAKTRSFQTGTGISKWLILLGFIETLIIVIGAVYLVSVFNQRKHHAEALLSIMNTFAVQAKSVTDPVPGEFKFTDDLGWTFKPAVEGQYITLLDLGINSDYNVTPFQVHKFQMTEPTPVRWSSGNSEIVDVFRTEDGIIWVDKRTPSTIVFKGITAGNFPKEVTLKASYPDIEEKEYASGNGAGFSIYKSRLFPDYKD